MDAPRSEIPDKWLYVGLLVLIAWLPIPLGSSRPWSLGILEIAAFGLLSLWLLLKSATPLAETGILKQYRIILLLMSLSLGYQLLQVFPLPLKVIEFLSPATANVYRYAIADIADQYFTISLDPGLSLKAFLKSASYFSIFFLVLVLINSWERARQLIYVVIFVSLAESCWALVDFYHDGATVGERASGTYTNPNHFAALLELGISVALGMSISLSERSIRSPNWRIRLSAVLDWLLKDKARLYVSLIIMFAALFYSASRGAIFSLFFAVFATLILVLFLRGWKTREARILARISLLVLVAVSWLGADNFITRLETYGLQADRPLLNRATYRMIADYPLFGIGAGNWQHLYPMYRDPQMTTILFARHAHNDHLELISEQGVIGYGLIGSAVGLAILKMIMALRWRRDPLMRGILFACVAGGVSLLVHAWVEFNFHIPANAAWFYLVLALGLVASRLRRQE
ncbi:MAG: O-antigen ligase family protein [Gammaproteobacteria bacterium]|nr:O-antigen ligase family protein [Gammaproteobacteria bacterium]